MWSAAANFDPLFYLVPQPVFVQDGERERQISIHQRNVLMLLSSKPSHLLLTLASYSTTTGCTLRQLDRAEGTLGKYTDDEICTQYEVEVHQDTNRPHHAFGTALS